MRQTFVLVVCSFFVNYSVQSVEKCTTPNEKCVSIYDCERLLRMLVTGNNEEKEFLKESNCGWVGVLNPKVCCGTDTAVRFQPESPLLPDRTLCGFEDERFKIINGDNADITLIDSPWSALLVYDVYGQKSYKCGGVLISDRYVLTAAHCQEPELSPRWVRFGEFDLRSLRDCTSVCSEFFDVEVEDFIKHPHYRKNIVEGLLNDIALIRLYRTVKFTTFVQPICLPRGSSERSGLGSELLIAGWGATNNEQQWENSVIKQKIQIPLISLSECQKKYADKNTAIYLKDSLMCAGGVRNKTTCKGDSGGALVANSKDKLTQHYVEGILSYSLKGCLLNMPAVFTRVSEFLPWINENIKL